MSAPSRWRSLGAGLVLVWMTVLALAAWPGIVRPAFLDGANGLAVNALRLFGMSAGQPLFQTDVSPWKQHGFCFLLRESGAGGTLLFPPEGECRILGFHPRLPPVARATHRMLAAAWREREGDALQRSASRGYLEAIGRAFCRARDPEPPGVEGVWVWTYLHYDDGRLLRRNGLYFDYACESGRLREVLWHPDDAQVLARWGEAPW